MNPSLLKQKIVKIELWKISINFTINTSILTKKKYDSEKVKDKEKRWCDYKQSEIIDKKKQKSGWTEEKSKREMLKPLWFEINKKEFEELRRNIYNNQDNNDFKIIITRRTYDLKNAKKILDGSNYT